MVEGVEVAEVLNGMKWAFLQFVLATADPLILTDNILMLFIFQRQVRNTLEAVNGIKNVHKHFDTGSNYRIYN